MKTIDLLSEDECVGLKTALMLLLSSNPSLSQFDEYLNYFREMVKYQCKIGGRENLLGHRRGNPRPFNDRDESALFTLVC